MKRLCQGLAVCLLLWGCAASQPPREIEATFRSFLQAVKAGNQEIILATAPFLATLTEAQRSRAIRTFTAFALEEPSKLRVQAARGAGESYLLRVSAPGGAAAIVVPFHRNQQGAWEMSPVIESVQHIDVVPAR